MVPDALSDIVSLFDDPDTTVSGCVDEWLLQQGHPIVATLHALAREEGDEEKRQAILARAASVNASLRLKDISRQTRLSGPAFSLYEALFLISSLLDANLTRDAFQSSFIKRAAPLGEELNSSRTAMENITIFNHHFFGEGGFSITDRDFGNLSDATLPEVLESGKGNPVTVAILYFLLAEECSLPLLPLCFDGGFIPAWVENGREVFYINLNDSGAPVMEVRSKGEKLLHSVRILPGILMESLIAVCSNCALSRRAALLKEALNRYSDERFLGEV